MRFRVILRYIGFVFLMNAAFLFISAIISIFDSYEAFFPLMYSAVVTAMFGVFPFI